MISAIITTYKEPEALDLCLQSAVEGQKNQNEIIVVVDGYYDVNKKILDKYEDHISILNLEENVGMVKAMNLGHYNATNELVFHVQDDNVFPKNWDIILEKNWKEGCVITPNQIEPYPSMFPQFNIKDLGRDPKEFNLKAFWDYESTISKNLQEECGSTFPFLISKQDYLKIGGFDESYPGPWVVDWEFFMKCKLSGLKMVRSWELYFYHFVSLGTKSPSQLQEAKLKEELCHKYALYKWGAPIQHNPSDNSKFISFN
tara:strand:+ start:20595 stop:21368 length:774 start_codon:yes stop_codon:yes gene_type:complete